MAFTGSFMCSSFKVDLLFARHNFAASGGNTFKMALYTSGASMTAAQTAYTATSEVSSSGTNYTTTGTALTRVDPVAAVSPITTAIVDFTPDPVWAGASFTARGALIYNDTLTTPVADAAVAVLDFLADKTATAGDFTVTLPAADGTNAVLRIA